MARPGLLVAGARGFVTAMRQVAYALTSAGRDIYSASVRLSAASVRLTNPGTAIVVACDDLTARALKDRRDPLLDEVDDLVVVKTGPGSARRRSRLVKTQLTSVIDGPFLFLDADTLVQSDLGGVFATDADVSAAPNNSADDIPAQYWQPDSQTLADLGWQHHSAAYFNSGVVLFAGSANARALGKLWHEKYEAAALRGYDRDQPAFNSALSDGPARVAVLGHEFNAQFRCRPEVAENAKILHFFASWRYPETRYDRLLARLLAEDTFPVRTLETIIRRRSAARRGVLFEDTPIRRIAGRALRLARLRR